MPELITNLSIAGGQGKSTVLQTLAIELSKREYPCVIRDLDGGSKRSLALKRHDLPFEIIGISDKRPSNMINLLDTPANYLYNAPDEALRYLKSSNIILICVSGGESSVSNALELLAHLYALEMVAKALEKPVKLLNKVIIVFSRNNDELACHNFRQHTPQLGQNIKSFFALPNEPDLEARHAKGQFINANDSKDPTTYAVAISELCDLIEGMCNFDNLKLSEAV